MQKSLFLLPLVAVVALAGCNAASSSEESSSDTVISTPNPTWQAADIQPTEMPSSMNQGAVQPNYGASVPAGPAPTTPSYSNNQPNYGAQTESIGNCQVVRNADGVPVYAQMTKGCYTDSTYTVGAKDTLYLISFLSGTSPSQIASLNNMSTTTKLKVGQSLRVR